MHASVSVTLYISYLMLKERTTRVCIVQVSHAHPPLAAAVFNCYQMYTAKLYFLNQYVGVCVSCMTSYLVHSDSTICTKV